MLHLHLLILRSRLILVSGASEAGGLVVLVQVRLQCKGFIATFAAVVLEGRMRLHVCP